MHRVPKKHISIWLDEDVAKLLGAVARRERVSLAHVIRRALLAECGLGPQRAERVPPIKYDEEE